MDIMEKGPQIIGTEVRLDDREKASLSFCILTSFPKTIPPLQKKQRLNISSHVSVQRQSRRTADDVATSRKRNLRIPAWSLPTETATAGLSKRGG